MSEGHEGHEHGENSHEEEILDLELDTQSRIFLQMRAQNLELLRIASQVAGYGAGHSPLKSGDVKNALKGIWDLYAEFYSWIDPEEAGGEEDEDEE